MFHSDFNNQDKMFSMNNRKLTFQMCISILFLHCICSGTVGELLKQTVSLLFSFLYEQEPLQLTELGAIRLYTEVEDNPF